MGFNRSGMDGEKEDIVSDQICPRDTENNRKFEKKIFNFFQQDTFFDNSTYRNHWTIK